MQQFRKIDGILKEEKSKTKYVVIGVSVTIFVLLAFIGTVVYFQVSPD